MSNAYHRHVTSTVLEAPIEAVWAVVRDILKVVEIVIGDAAHGLRWTHGASAEHVPARFQFKLADGSVAHEEVTARSETEHSIEYRANGVVLTMAEYAAAIRLQPVTLPAGQTFVTYERTFSFIPGVDHADALAMITGIMDNEMVALRQYFAKENADV
ncbi:MAG TPA: SRPBCC family protein [Herpetosiphonaceae bacterium]|nr:SRPBCC family protein [Herpetosiphonaceae bacterium]